MQILSAAKAITSIILAAGMISIALAQAEKKTEKAPAPNQKAPVLTIGGSGTIGKIPKWTTTTDLGDSVITESGTSIGIGTTSPSAKLEASTGTSTSIKGVSSNILGIGVYGYVPSLTGGTIGVKGLTLSSSGIGVKGTALNGEGGTGVFGEAFGPEASGVKGINYRTDGIGYGVKGEAFSPNAMGIVGINNTGGTGYSAGYGGWITGRLYVNGYIQKLGGSFKIDHPLDPDNKYLVHSFVESPDMKNIYDGVVVFSRNGLAVVTMPDWFDALNREFRYQLTCIGGYSPVYVAQELNGNQFVIGGGYPGLKVSWQVTGIRKDVFAEKHRLPVEELKPERERGFYLTPELFDKPEEKGIEWAHDPEGMKKHKQVRERLLRKEN